MITISEEKVIDYDTTARLATEAAVFENWSAPPVTFSGGRCSPMPASMTGYRRFPGSRRRRACGRQCSFNCAILILKRPMCD
jgi:hypothetical protein